MSRHCPSCGGILGRDCFNPIECAQQAQQEIQIATHEWEQRFWKLVEIIEKAGIDCSELIPIEKPTPEPVRDMDGAIVDDLPF